MSDLHFDHVALLVRDLEQSVKDYKEFLSVLDPENSTEVVFFDGKEQGHAYRAATFVSKNGKTVIQFITSENPRDVARLEKIGECVHHLEFCTSDVEGVNKKLKAAKVPMLSEEPFVSPKKTHGVMVKVATKYKVSKGGWVPDRG